MSNEGKQTVANLKILYQTHTVTFYSSIMAISSAFNTIVPSKLVIKLEALGLDPALCNWVLDFLTGHPQVVRLGNSISTPLILNTGVRSQPSPVLPVHP